MSRTNDTERAREIVTSDRGQGILNHVSPIYGESRLALWIFQMLGAAFEANIEQMYDFALQTDPATATWSLEFWEDAYEVMTNPDLTIEERQNQLLAKRSTRWASTPWRIEHIVRTMTGLTAQITEHTGPNRFAVRIFLTGNYRMGIDFVKREIDRIKPAHMTYDLTSFIAHEMTTNGFVGCAVNQTQTINITSSNR